MSAFEDAVKNLMQRDFKLATDLASNDPVGQTAHKIAELIVKLTEQTPGLDQDTRLLVLRMNFEAISVLAKRSQPQSLQSSLAKAGILPGTLHFKKRAALAAAHPTNGRVYVNIRRHPSGAAQPLGRRAVSDMNTSLKSGHVWVELASGHGWMIDMGKPPTFLDFRLGDDGAPNVQLPEAVQYWQRFNGRVNS